MADKTILVVDDEPDFVAAVRAALEEAGYRVVTAADGNMGLALAERENPALVVVDMMMPKKSGFAVLERLKQRPGGGPRVVMVTANEGTRHREYARKLGVDDYILKPFEMEQLLASVRRLCPGDANGSGSGE